VGGNEFARSIDSCTGGEAAELHAGRCWIARYRRKTQAIGQTEYKRRKFFSSIELMTLLADCEWLDEATKTIGQFWKRKIASRKAFNLNK
jgi:hypothetical protein